MGRLNVAAIADEAYRLERENERLRGRVAALEAVLKAAQDVVMQWDDPGRTERYVEATMRALRVALTSVQGGEAAADAARKGAGDGR